MTNNVLGESERLAIGGLFTVSCGGKIVTLPQDSWRSSYGGNGVPELPPHGAGRLSWVVRLVTILVVVFLGGATAAVLLLSRADLQPGRAPASADVPAAPDEVDELPAPVPVTGTATLSDPTITTAKASYRTASEWCSLLTAEDVRAATGFEQRGLPDSTLLCTHYFTDHDGHLFVSDIPAIQGAAHLVRGNTAIIYQSDLTSCEVSIALNRGGGLLDIDVRGVPSPRVPLCQAVVDLAGRAFDRLPAA